MVAFNKKTMYIWFAVKRLFSLLTFFILPTFNTNAQNNAAIYPEIKSERSMYSKVFLKAPGVNQAVISGSPVHYKISGVWEEINTNITSNNGSYQNETNVIRSYFPGSINSSNKIKLSVNASDELFIHSEKKLVLVNDQSDLTIIAGNSNNSIANVINSTINYSGIYPGISDEFSILNGQIKNNVVLSALPSLLINVTSGYFGFQEIIELPTGWKITTSDKTLNALTSSAIYITDSNGKNVLTIPSPVFFDSYGLKLDGASMVEGKYLVKQENTGWSITTLVPVDWLKNSNTKYPVSMDPTVVLASTTGGWQSPNNFVDNPVVVFIGVCCGNLTHRAWMKFNTTTIPTTSCITDVEVQPNVTGEANALPELTFINDVTGAFGPYGAITPAAYNDFGTGTYTSFTILGTGIYGYYSLGAAACALLQAQLPGGWFSPAFQFNNEPSVNYKIISGTLSNLRVTYVAPPCVVLSVELVSFDAICNNSKVNINWTTSTQKNNDHFTIERSADGIKYETVGTISGAGNSEQNLNYSFEDAVPLTGTSYYLLKQTDSNGQNKDLKLVAVSCNGVKEVTIGPNPNTGKFNIEGAEQNSEIIITDILGQIVFQTKITEEKTDVDLNKHLSGIYFIQVITTKGSVSKKISINK